MVKNLYGATKKNERKPWEEFTDEDLVEALLIHNEYSKIEEFVRCLDTFPEYIQDRVIKEMILRGSEGIINLGKHSLKQENRFRDAVI
ncbi:MAG: hypothetical protein QXO70_01220 [Candidatus Pacearchaeota archaeon]